EIADLPFGPKATEETPRFCRAEKECNSRPSLRSNSFVSPLSDPASNSESSRESATDNCSSVRPEKDLNSWPERASQSFKVRRAPAETHRVPSRVTARSLTRRPSALNER